MSAPQSTIYICSGVRLNSRYEHSLYFATPADQQGYFAGKVVKTLSAYSYLRKSWPIKVEATMEQAKTWNYLYFRNSASGKLYYYFINSVEYVNDNTVELGLELDVLQTYLFDFDLLPCFVERQHVERDAIGDHTVDEGLELGEYVNNGVYNFNLSDLCIMVMCTINPNSTTAAAAEVHALPYRYNGVFSGVKIWAVDGADWVEWGKQIDKLDELGVSDSIISMWMYPKSLVVLGGEDSWDSGEIAHVVERAFGLNDGGTVSPVTRPTDLNYYVPRNNKLLVYPYNFIYATNNQGNAAVYKYEYFIVGSNPTFKLTGSLGPDGGTRLVPVSYKFNGEANYDEGLTLNNFPTCAWDSDTYKIWLAQNQNTQAFNTATAGLKVAAGAVSGIASLATGNVLGAGAGLGTAVSGGLQIGQQLAQKKDMDIAPPQSKGSFSSGVNITNNKQTFTLYLRSVAYEHARIIDDYFTMYGYKLNRVQTPNINARQHFTYVKTIGCHIKGNMCNEDTVKIEGIFDKGITFWNNGDKVADYSQSNPVWEV